MILFCSQFFTRSNPHVDRCSNPLPWDPLVPLKTLQRAAPGFGSAPPRGVGCCAVRLLGGRSPAAFLQAPSWQNCNQVYLDLLTATPLIPSASACGQTLQRNGRVEPHFNLGSRMIMQSEGASRSLSSVAQPGFTSPSLSLALSRLTLRSLSAPLPPCLSLSVPACPCCPL